LREIGLQCLQIIADIIQGFAVAFFCRQFRKLCQILKI